MNCTHRSFVRNATTWAVAVLILVAPPLIEQAFADRQQAQQHYEAGHELYKSGDYQGAIREFETANRLAPSPVLDYNIGLARERLGQLELAVQHYRAYITAMPNASNRDSVDAKIQTLEKELAEQRAGAPAPPDTDNGIGGRRPQPTDTADVTTDPDPASGGTTPTMGSPVDVTGKAAETTGDEAVNSVTAERSQGLRRVAQIDIGNVRDERRSAISAQPDAPVPTASHEDFGTKKKAKPAYKKWWFWAIVGVSAYILIDLAVADDPNNRALPDSPLDGGAVLVRF